MTHLIAHREQTPTDVAIREHPELARLLLLSQVGPPWAVSYRFHNGAIAGVMLGRHWPDTNHHDELGIRDQLHARATRRNPFGVILWERAGSLSEVVGEMLDDLLAAPNVLDRVLLRAVGRASELWAS